MIYIIFYIHFFIFLTNSQQLNAYNFTKGIYHHKTTKHDIYSCLNVTKQKDFTVYSTDTCNSQINTMTLQWYHSNKGDILPIQKVIIDFDFENLYADKIYFQIEDETGTKPILFLHDDKKNFKVVKCVRLQGDKVPCLIETPYYCVCPKNLTPNGANQRCFGITYRNIMDWRKAHLRWGFIFGSCTKQFYDLRTVPNGYKIVRARKNTNYDCEMCLDRTELSSELWSDYKKKYNSIRKISQYMKKTDISYPLLRGGNNINDDDDDKSKKSKIVTNKGSGSEKKNVFLKYFMYFINFFIFFNIY